MNTGTFVVVRTDKSFTTVEVGDAANLILRELEDILHRFGLLLFKTKDDFLSLSSR